MTGAEIREQFLRYFEGKGHTRVDSSPLIAKDDPTLLFTNAGMVQFKNVFTGREKRQYTRATTAQKCLRVSGKHNDLENVGYTPRHHTFFEMLGNFSFGDYFKEDAIAFGWEFLSETVGLDKARLHVTIYRDDDEADRIWKKVLGPNANPIVRLGEKDNFWSMGDTGPCGPCSEIHIDQGEDFGCGRPDCAPGCDCDRFLELWNLVFMQFDRDASGNMTPLPHPCIDTGLGLERLAAVKQGVRSNWETDLFLPLIDAVEKIRGWKYGRVPEHDVAMRVIADHTRAAAFLIADGTFPSNEGPGYVLRRLLRRSVRYAMRLGAEQEKPLLNQVAEVAVATMGAAYPELIEHESAIDTVIKKEEALFKETLGKAEIYCLQKVNQAKTRGELILPGEDAFMLYDTYGLPPDVAKDIAKEAGIGFDEDGFNRAMDLQKELARAARKDQDLSIQSGWSQLGDELKNVCFTGYEKLEDSGTILAIIKDGQSVQEASSGDTVEMVTDRTPFYGESGGQVGDHGTISRNGDEMEVQDTQKPFPELITHKGVIKAGSFHVGDRVDLKVERSVRRSIMANHSATHLLQWALRKVLGDHVKQSGSLVEAGRLRFDFTHFSPITPEELVQIEDLVNEKIRENLPVNATTMSLDEARTQGAMALFGEKYGDTVRMVSMGDVSKELCGGTHADRTGDIAVFKILSEGGIAAGVRRIEAVTGTGALEYVRSLEDETSALGERLRGSRGELVRKLDKLLDEKKTLEREVQRLKGMLAGGQTTDLLAGVRDINGIRVLARRVDHVASPKDLRDYADRVRDKLGSGVALLAAEAEGKVFLTAVVTKDLVGRFHAGNIVKAAAACVGGSGGGRPDMAQAGGPDASGLDKALATLNDIV